MRMPGMDGAALLKEVQQRYPQVVRIVLSGQADEASVLRSLGATHQYLSKPCDPETLKQTLQRACAVRRLLDESALKQVVSQVGALPSPPSVYVALVNECQSANGSVRRVADLVAQDIGMTAQVLHLVNSAFFGRRRRISDPLQAVQVLGLNTLRALVLSAEVFEAFDVKPAPGFSLEAVQAHCLATSACARLIAASEGCGEEMAGDATIAALLHEAGTLILAGRLPARYAEVLALAASRSIGVTEAEQELLGATHAGIGAYLLGLWALPDPVVEAVAYHKTPALCAHAALSPLTIVHAAEAIIAETAPILSDPRHAEPDPDYLERLGLADRYFRWQARWHREQELTST
jgi:HD-like signal output (HDOD) protein